MKSFIVILALFASQISMAKPSISVNHSHNGRAHQHPLPANGLAHRHGSGASGVAVVRQGGTISSRVEYGGSKPPPVRSTTRQSPSSSRFPSGFLVLGNESARDQNPRDNQNTRNTNPSLRFDKADPNCKLGEADCNICVSDMRKQFQKASTDRISWKSRPWRFNWPQKYPPFGLTPKDIFDGVPAYALGIPDTHIQGFVKTNSPRFPFAGSHSHKSKGGIFVVKQNVNGGLSLSTLSRTNSRHPSGVHVLGKYLIYAEGNQLVFKNLNTPHNTNDYKLKISKPLFGGGLGLTRLSKDNYLLITTGPGGQKTRPRYHHFYHLKFNNGRPNSLLFLGQSQSTVPSNWPRPLRYSENVSVLTECGTGKVYTIHTTGDEKGVSAIKGNGYWRLSVLETTGGKLALRSLYAFSTRQNMSSCNIRAAATAFADRQHRLNFYCHGYAKDPDGSLFNVLGSSSRNADFFKFKTGTVY